jgi:hypothetical protein
MRPSAEGARVPWPVQRHAIVAGLPNPRGWRRPKYVSWNTVMYTFVPLRRASNDRSLLAPPVTHLADPRLVARRPADSASVVEDATISLSGCSAFS